MVLVRTTLIFSILRLASAETTIDVKGQLFCCNKGLDFLVENLTSNSPFKPGSPHNQLIIPSDKGSYPDQFVKQRGCYLMANQKVDLWERDLVDPDDFKNSENTDNQGFFEIKGTESWDPSVEWYLKVQHTCMLTLDQVNRKCQRITKFDIPKEHNDGKFEFQWYIGGMASDEELVCPK